MGIATERRERISQRLQAFLEERMLVCHPAAGNASDR